MEPTEFAHMYHTVYQRLAPKFGLFASGLEYGDLPGQTKMLDEAVAADILERLRTVIRATECTNIGMPADGDVIVIRYFEGFPDSAERKKDYVAIRDYFQRSGVRVRLLGISGEMSLDQVSEIEMAQFGWFKKR